MGWRKKTPHPASLRVPTQGAEKGKEREGREERKGSISNQPIRSLGWAGGPEILGAEGQKGAPHPHTLLPDCPDTEAADAPSLILDNHTASWGKVEMRGGRPGRRREEETEDRENTTQTLKTASSLVPQPRVRGWLGNWGFWWGWGIDP